MVSGAYTRTAARVPEIAATRRPAERSPPNPGYCQTMDGWKSLCGLEASSRSTWVELRV